MKNRDFTQLSVSSEDYPYCPHATVLVGVDRWVTLCCLVTLVPNYGQVWHTMTGQFVISRVDVRGEILWSVLGCSLTEFMVAMKVPANTYVGKFIHGMPHWAAQYIPSLD